MKIQHIFFLLISLAFFACNDSSDSGESTAQPNDPGQSDVVVSSTPFNSNNDGMQPPPNQHTSWDAYKDDFVNSLKNGNKIRVTELMFFPFRGAPMQTDSLGLTKEQFVDNYDKIFTKELIDHFANASDDDWIEAKVENKNQAMTRNTPMGTTVRAFTKNYVFNAGKSNQTESMVTFYFARWGNNYWLTSMLIAG